MQNLQWKHKQKNRNHLKHESHRARHWPESRRVCKSITLIILFSFHSNIQSSIHSVSHIRWLYFSSSSFIWKSISKKYLEKVSRKKVYFRQKVHYIRLLELIWLNWIEILLIFTWWEFVFYTKLEENYYKYTFKFKVI